MELIEISAIVKFRGRYNMLSYGLFGYAKRTIDSGVNIYWIDRLNLHYHVTQLIYFIILNSWIQGDNFFTGR